ncbi:PD-(D/E)XK nuclease family transposase [Lachnospiraceae bacterium C1.1]|nr:PD-(D/E)XK nuclease family transposase [Lachnospiraceae bacterium C1.1]
MQIILERKDVRVVRVKGQVELKSPYPGGRNIKLDIDAIDGNGIEFDVEVQRNTKGSNIRRPRFHQSMMDSRLLKKNQEFKELRKDVMLCVNHLQS